jgi:hypothetical protein
LSGLQAEEPRTTNSFVFRFEDSPVSAPTDTRSPVTHEERFRRLLSAWLATLTPNGWTGGVSALFAALWAFERVERFFVSVPSGSALSKALLREQDTVRAAGFTLRLGRTKSARFITFARASA